MIHTPATVLRRYMTLCEGRDAPLYHFTRLDGLMQIVKTDSLGHAEGVSLTRDVNTPFFSHGFWHKAVLVLDQTKLQTQYALEPRGGTINTTDSTLFVKSNSDLSTSKEAEEFIHRPITPLHPYLMQIVISDSKPMTDLMRYMRRMITGRPMPKTWSKFEAFVKGQFFHERALYQHVLDPENWRTLFAYCQQYQIPLVQQPLRMTFGRQRANLWHRH